MAYCEKRSEQEGWDTLRYFACDESGMFRALHNISASIALLIAITFWHVWWLHRNRFNWHSTGIPISFFAACALALQFYVLINIIRDAAAAAASTVFLNFPNLDTEKKWKSKKAKEREKKKIFHNLDNRIIIAKKYPKKEELERIPRNDPFVAA